jgi:hypothetical protein
VAKTLNLLHTKNKKHRFWNFEILEIPVKQAQVQWILTNSNNVLWGFL